MKEVINWKEVSKELPKIHYEKNLSNGVFDDDWFTSDICLIKTQNGTYGMAVLDSFKNDDDEEEKKWYINDAYEESEYDKVVYWIYPEDIIIKE